jgi:Flp pilus assembly protein TadG
MKTDRIRATERRRTRSSRSGQTVVELAMLLPLLLVLCVGAIEIGRYAYFDILIANAARAGAQYGAQSLIQAADLNGITAAAQNDGLNGMTVAAIQQCTCPGGTPGACPTGAPACTQQQVYVQVTTSDTYDSLFGFSWLPVPKQMFLTSTVTMRVSQ